MKTASEFLNAVRKLNRWNLNGGYRWQLPFFGCDFQGWWFSAKGDPLAKLETECIECLVRTKKDETK